MLAVTWSGSSKAADSASLVTVSAIGPVAGITVRVESVQADGSRKVVSHFNKKYKGELARALAQAPSAATVCDAAGVADIATAAGYAVEVRGNQLTVVVGVVADTSADTA